MLDRAVDLDCLPTLTFVVFSCLSVFDISFDLLFTIIAFIVVCADEWLGLDPEHFEALFGASLMPTGVPAPPSDEAGQVVADAEAGYDLPEGWAAAEEEDVIERLLMQLPPQDVVALLDVLQGPELQVSTGSMIITTEEDIFHTRTFMTLIGFVLRVESGQAVTIGVWRDDVLLTEFHDISFFRRCTYVWGL